MKMMIQLVQISHRLVMSKKYSVIWKKAKGMLMIEIYTKKQDSPDWILLNDMYFNVVQAKYDFENIWTTFFYTNNLLRMLNYVQ